MKELKEKGATILSEEPFEGVGGIITFVRLENANNVLLELMETTC